ncbi:MAG TPA: phosphoadenylyl-sulfate reductase [Myxococcota bacterium]|jgi:phosphoadenosine phosphosulfate reductase|nr:phosphoadenylyl-sulfate reductase [Myxococcota bacterium]
MDAAEIKALSATFETRTPPEILAWAYETFGARVGLSTAFGASGSVLIDMACKAGLDPHVFTLQTRRLFPETLAFKEMLEKHYGTRIALYEPALSDAAIDAQYGADLTTQDPDRCCFVRKVEPMRRAVAGLDAWISGVRRDQGGSRALAPVLQPLVVEGGRTVVKCHPLVRWTRKDVWKYIFDHQVPYHPLLDQGYSSVGCWPCTTPVAAGEDERAGRWRGTDKTECGIHTQVGEVKG